MTDSEWRAERHHWDKVANLVGGHLYGWDGMNRGTILVDGDLITIAAPVANVLLRQDAVMRSNEESES